MMTAALCFFYNIHEICDLTIYKSLCPANTAWIQVQCSLLSASILRHFDLLFWHALSIFLQPLVDFNFSCLQFRDLPFFVYEIYPSVVPNLRLTSCQFQMPIVFELCLFCFQDLASFVLNLAWLYLDLDCLLFKISAPTLHACFYCFARF